MKRRQFIQNTIIAGVVPLCGSQDPDPNTVLGNTPPLSVSEQEAIATALGKKGTYNEVQADLAKKYAQAIGNTKLFPANQPTPVAQSGTTPSTGKDLFDLPALDALVKYAGVVNGPTYKYTVGRDDVKIIAMGVEMTAAIGLNSWASFAGKAADAHIAGDIAMLEGEVNSVVRTLRQHKLEVVALHHHMLGEQPRTIFLHYYGRGPATELAKGFRAALDQLGKGGKKTDEMRH